MSLRPRPRGHPRPGAAAPPRRDQLRELGGRVGTVAAVALAFSLPMPSLVAPAIMSSFLFYGSIGMVIMALWRSEQAFPRDRLNRWDAAALLLLASLLAGLAVDAGAVEAYFDERLRPAATEPE